VWCGGKFGGAKRWKEGRKKERKLDLIIGGETDGDDLIGIRFAEDSLDIYRFLSL
jgi:hypothetical protein